MKRKKQAAQEPPLRADKTDKPGANEQDDGYTVEERELLAHHGMAGLLKLGLGAAAERKFKNRIIYTLAILCVALSVAVSALAFRTIEPVLLAEDRGKIRPLPLLSNPIYSQSDILAWADRCIRDIYDLSYVDWKESIRNNTMCLSDSARKNFVSSLGEIGVLQLLTPDKLGLTHAIPGKPSVRFTQMEGRGEKRQYHTWVIDIPFTVHLDGRERGRINMNMAMKVARVPLSIRESGIWVEDYKIRAGER